MKIERKNKNTSKIFIVAILIAALLAVGGFWIYLTYFTNDSSSSDATKKSSDISADQEPVNETNLAPAKGGNSNETEKNEADNSNSASPNPLSASITSAAQNGGTLQIRTLIEKVTSSGTCTLELSKTGSNTITKNASVQALSSSSTCAGFNIPTSELSSGTWRISITITSGDDEAHLTESVVVS